MVKAMASQGIPLHLALKRHILGKIQEGTLKAGDRVPTEHELMAEHRVSRITARRVLNDLAGAGHVVRHRRRGTFVAQSKILHRGGRVDGVVEDLRQQGYDIDIEVMRHERLVPPQSIVQLFGLPSREPVLMDQRLVSANGVPLVLARGYYNVPEAVVIDRQRLPQVFMLSLLRDEFGIAASRNVRQMEAVNPTATEARLLGVTTSTPMISSEQTAYDDRDQAWAHSIALYRGDRYKHIQSF